MSKQRELVSLTISLSVAAGSGGGAVVLRQGSGCLGPPVGALAMIDPTVQSVRVTREGKEANGSILELRT